MAYSPPLPFCQLQRPLACAPPDSLLSVFLSTVPAYHQAVRPLPDGVVHPDYFTDAFLAERRRVQCQSKDWLYHDVTDVIRRWFSDLDSPHTFIANATVLTRILSVLHALSSYERLAGDYMFDYRVRCVPRVVPVPGGNVDMLLWLAWRYLHALAREGVKVGAGLAGWTEGLDAADAVFKFITHAGTVPGHDFARAGNRRLSDADVALWPGPVTAMRVPLRAALSQLARAVRRGSGHTRTGRFTFVEPDGVHARNMNYRLYCDAARDVLEALVTLLRLVGHIVAVGRRMVCPREMKIGLEYGTPGPFKVGQLDTRWGYYATLLSEIKAADATMLDGYFVDSAARTGVEPWFWALTERETTAWVNEFAWVAVATEWGLLPGDADNIQRAGPRCVPTHVGIIMPSDIYSPPPELIVEYPHRDGPHSLTARLAAVVDTRRDPGTVPKPPPGSDHFYWAEDWSPSG
jgi:hypothetical protein